MLNVSKLKNKNVNMWLHSAIIAKKEKFQGLQGRKTNT